MYQLKKLADAKETIMDFVNSFNREEPTSMIIMGDYGVGKAICVWQPPKNL